MPKSNKKNSPKVKLNRISQYMLRSKEAGAKKNNSNFQSGEQDLQVENNMAEACVAETHSTTTVTDSKPEESIQTTSTKTVISDKEVSNSDIKELIITMTEKLNKRIDSLQDKIDNNNTLLQNSIEKVEKRLHDVELKHDSIDKKTSLNQAKIAAVEANTPKLAEFQALSDKVKQIELDFEKSISYESKRVDKLETDIPNPDMIKTLQDKIVSLENQNEYQEWRSRRYNLLFYGIEEKADENTTKTLRDFLQNTCKLDTDRISSMGIGNCHRLPKNPDADPNYKPGAPQAIIAKFLLMSERNWILFSPKNLPKGMAIRTDLPARLKKKRALLAREAYTIRKRDKKLTIIRESPNDVWLETRAKKGDLWVKHSGTNP